MNEAVEVGAVFDLEAPPIAGHVPQRVIEELRCARRIAKDYSQSYGDAIAAQAAKYTINKAALRRYVSALEDDKLGELDAEAEAIITLTKD